MKNGTIEIHMEEYNLIYNQAKKIEGDLFKNMDEIAPRPFFITWKMLQPYTQHDKIDVRIKSLFYVHVKDELYDLDISKIVRKRNQKKVFDLGFQCSKNLYKMYQDIFSKPLKNVFVITEKMAELTCQLVYRYGFRYENQRIYGIPTLEIMNFINNWCFENDTQWYYGGNWITLDDTKVYCLRGDNCCYSEPDECPLHFNTCLAKEESPFYNQIKKIYDEHVGIDHFGELLQKTLSEYDSFHNKNKHEKIVLKPNLQNEYEKYKPLVKTNASMEIFLHNVFFSVQQAYEKWAYEEIDLLDLLGSDL